MDLPVFPDIANIYMEYFEELALGPKCPIPTSWWKRYVDDITCITKKDQVDTLFNHINQLDDHTKFTMENLTMNEAPPSWTPSVSPIPTTLYMPLCIENTAHTDRYLDWNSNHPVSAKRSIIQALTHRAKVVCSTPELLAGGWTT